RGGDVIPQILGYLPEMRPADAEEFVFPSQCPCELKTPVVRDEIAGGGEGVVRRCMGEFACPFQRRRHLKHFVSRQAFDIEGLGEKQIDAFYDDEDLPVRTPADIFTLARRDAANLRKLKDREGYGAVSARKLFEAIEARRRITLDRMIYALGIRHVGEATARTLARAYGDWQSFHAAANAIVAGGLESEAAAEMMALEDIGPAVVLAISRYFREKHNADRVDELVAELEILPVEQAVATSPV